MTRYSPRRLARTLALQGMLLPCAVSSVARADTSDPAPKPNILFILTEDQGTHLGCLGTPGLQTPRIDGLAQRGMLFRNAFVAYPVCSSSKACLYTGRHNHDTGLLNNTPNYHKPVGKLTPQELSQPLYVRNRIRAEIPTLTEILHMAGYYQGVTHKLHVAPCWKGSRMQSPARSSSRKSPTRATCRTTACRSGPSLTAAGSLSVA